MIGGMSLRVCSHLSCLVRIKRTLVRFIWVRVNAAIQNLVRTKQKTWVSVHFQMNSGALRMKYECNMGQILLNEPKTGCNDKMQHYVTWSDDAERVVYPKQNEQRANVEQWGLLWALREFAGGKNKIICTHNNECFKSNTPIVWSVR